MKIWNTSQVSCQSAQQTPYWVNVEDLRELADNLAERAEACKRITPGNVAHHTANLSMVLAHWAERIKEVLQ